MAKLADSTFRKIMEIVRGDDIYEVNLPCGAVAHVDKRDENLVSGYRWYRSRGYVRHTIPGNKGILILHRMLLGVTDPKIFIDHIDGDPLNNRRYNLRLCTHAENMRNRNSASGASRFKGVHLCRGSWRAVIQFNGKKIGLGSFSRESMAAKAYDKAAKEYFGEFAKTNLDLGLY